MNILAYAMSHGRKPRRYVLALTALSGAAAIIAASALPAAADAPVGNNVYQIYNPAGMAMDLGLPYATIIQNTAGFASTQDWTFVPVSGQPNVYEIENYYSHECVYIGEPVQDIVPGTGLVDLPCEQDPQEEWFFVAADPGSPTTDYSIQSALLPDWAITDFPTEEVGDQMEVKPLDAAGAAGNDQLFDLFDIDG